MRVPLKGQSASVTLDASGNGTVQIGPISSRETWYPANAHVSANIGKVTNEAQCIVYVGDGVGPNNFRDGTLSGSSGDTSDAISNDIIEQGQYVFAVWAGGDPGVSATLTITGERGI